MAKELYLNHSSFQKNGNIRMVGSSGLSDKDAEEFGERVMLSWNLLREISLEDLREQLDTSGPLEFPFRSKRLSPFLEEKEETFPSSETIDLLYKHLHGLLPKTFRYLAQDKDGWWTAFFNIPEISENIEEWICREENSDFFELLFKEDKPNPNWRETLRAI